MTETDTLSLDQAVYRSAREALERVYDVLNDHDPARLGEAFTEDVVFDDPGWPQTIHGLGEMERFMGSLWRAMPDVRFEVLEVYIGVEPGHAAARMRVSGTATGRFDPPGFAPTGGPVGVEYGGFYEFRGERVARAKITLNMVEIGVQIGALPPPGSRAERLAARMQNVTAARMRRAARRR